MFAGVLTAGNVLRYGILSIFVLLFVSLLFSLFQFSFPLPIYS